MEVFRFNEIDERSSPKWTGEPPSYRKAFVALEPVIAEPVASATPGLASSRKAFQNAWLTVTALSVSGRLRSGAPFAFIRRQMDLTIDARLSPKSEENSKNGVSESLAHSL
jgi:hypothetical protein